ncbi:hypothetical protein BGZ58_004494 [Dissophora ornata]|nr:hypothetical protein BGZ58_004494 [Dissophora ornata]
MNSPSPLPPPFFNHQCSQGVILEASKLPHIFVKALGPVSDQNQYQLISKSGETMFRCREKEPPVWIALDEVVDPQNLGAILRTALFLGVDGVIVCHKNSSPLSAVVAKASVGALEVRPTYGVSSLMRFIQDSQKNGWHVVGAHVTFGSKRSRPLHTWPDTGVDQPTLLVMGSEGNGLRKQIMNQCDSFIQVPSLGTAVSNVDSLNVSVATGIILSKLMGGRFLSLPKNLKKFPLRHLTPGNYDETVLDKNDDNWGEEEEEEEEEEEGGDDDDDADDDEDDAADTKSAGSKKPLPF